MPRFIYTGSSWAASSWPLGPMPWGDQSTNLSVEWELDCKDLSEHGSHVVGLVEKIKTANLQLPVVWVYNEPLINLSNATGLSHVDFMQRSDWKELQQECNRFCLKQINSLGVPVLLIGGHCDITDCDLSNITVACPSWQKWLASKSGMDVQDQIIKVIPADGGQYDLSHCWGAEVIHRAVHQNPQVDPDPDLLTAVWDMYYFWQELERRNWFFEVHPNMKANIEFAKFVKPAVENFLTTT